MKKILLLFLFIISGLFFSQVGIGTTSPNTKSILDVVSVSKGVLLPRITQSQRDAISPGTSDTDRNGLLIYNTDTDCYNYWSTQESKWMSMCQNACDPSTFADYTIDCSQFPAADINTYSVGTNTSGSITFNINVIKTGPYSIQITNNNGITYTAAGTFAATGTQPVTVTGGGTPSSTPVNFVIKTNSVTSACTYKTFSYTYNCGSAIINPAMQRGMNKTGIITLPVTITGTGNIPGINTTVNGVTYSFAGVSNATSSTNSITINYTGTPNSDSTIISLTNSDATSCNVNISHPYGNAVYSGCSTQTNGNYTVETALTNSNNIVVTLTGITTPGYVNFETQDKNGIKFATNGNQVVTTSSNIVTLYPVASSTKLSSVTGNSVPNTSEETSNGNNGTSNQFGTYTITNTLTATTLPCSATFDVKPTEFDGAIMNMNYDGSSPNYWNTNNAQWATDGNYANHVAKDSRISLDISNKRSTGSTIAYFWNSAIKALGNITSWEALVESTADANSSAYAANGATLNPNARIGSLDCYQNSATFTPSTSGDKGAFGIGALGNGSGGYREMDDIGFTIQYNDGKYYKYRLIFDGGYSSNYTLMTRIILFGIYSTKPATYSPKLIDGSLNWGLGGNRNGGSAGDYWP